jgi:hypothetical protein
MASMTTIGLDLPLPEGAIVPGVERTFPDRRSVPPRTALALERLSHAIEYLADEIVAVGGPLTAHEAQMEAIRLLMALNREIYSECPQARSLWERSLSLLGFRAA